MAFKNIGNNFNKSNFKPLAKKDILTSTIPLNKEANFLERILALPQGVFGSVPDLVYGSKEGDNIIQRWLGNVGEGFQTLVTGTNKMNQKSTSDVLQQHGILTGDDTGSNILRTIIGITGDILLDPTTYLSGGTGAITKLEKVGKVANVLDKTSDIASAVDKVTDVVKAVDKIEDATIVADKIGDATKALSKAEDIIKTVDKAGDVVNVSKKTGEVIRDSNNLAEATEKASHYLKFKLPFQKEGLTITGKPAEALDLLQNPLGYTASKSWDLGKKIAPAPFKAAEYKFNELFRKGKNAETANMSTAVDDLKDAEAVYDNSDRLVEFKYGKLIEDLKTLPDNIKENLEEYVAGNIKIPSEYKSIVDDFGNAMLESRGAIKSMDLFKKKGLLGDISGEVTEMVKSNKWGKDLRESVLNRVDNLKSQIDSAPNLETKLKLQAQLKDLQDNVTKIMDRYPDLSTFMKFARKEQRGDLIGGITKNFEQLDEMPLFKDESLSSKLFSQADKNYYVPRKVIGIDRNYIQTGKLYQQLPEEVKEILDDLGLQPESIGEILLNNKRINRSLVKKGVVENDVLRDVLQKNIMELSDKQLLEMGITPKDLLSGNIESRIFDTQALGKEAGVVYDTNLPDVTADYLSRVQKASSLDQYIHNVSNLTDDSGKKIAFTAQDIAQGAEIPRGYMKIDNLPDIGELHVPKEIYPEMKTYFKDFVTSPQKNKVLQKVIDMNKEFLSIWKPSVTGKGPGFIGFHIRNAIGDLNNMILGGFRNRDGALTRGFDVVRFEKLAVKEGVEAATNKFGQEIKDLYEMSIKNNIIGKSNPLMDSKDFAHVGGEAYKKVKSAYNKVTDKVFMTQTLGMREDAFRVANLWDAYKKVGSWSEAIKIAKKSSLDYSNLTEFERGIQQLIPFYNFMRQNLEHQLTTFSQNPRALLIQQDIFDNIQKNLGANMSEEDWDALPEWMKQGLTIAIRKEDTPATKALKEKSGDDSPSRNFSILTGFGTPTSAINEFNLLDPKKLIESFAGKMTSPLKVPLELASGQDFFTNKPIKDNTFGERYKDAPQFIKDFLEFKAVETKRGKKVVTEYYINPYKKHLLNNMPFVQTWNTQAKRVNEAAEDPMFLLNLFSGGRVYNKDLDVEQARRERGL